jgi:hypothetical protein
MSKRLLSVAALAIVAMAPVAPAYAVIAGSYDDASELPYDATTSGGWQVGDNGGFGFAPWSVINNAVGGGSGGGFTATGNGFSQINTGAQAEAWGVYGNGGGVGQAIRPLGRPLGVDSTFSIAMDNGFIDGGGTVGLGLQNSAGFNLAEFYFVGGNSNYTLAAQNVSGTTPGFTDQGLYLTFTLTGLTSFLMTIDVLPTVGVDHVLTANLNNHANQSISQVRLFNANAGFNADHDAFFNNMSVVPELSAFVFGGVVCCLVGMSYGVKVFRRHRMANKPETI